MIKGQFSLMVNSELSMNPLDTVSASIANVLGSVLCLQNEEVDSPAQFQDEEARSEMFVYLFVSF